jgi:hypothetical protein
LHGMRASAHECAPHVELAPRASWYVVCSHASDNALLDRPVRRALLGGQRCVATCWTCQTPGRARQRAPRLAAWTLPRVAAASLRPLSSHPAPRDSALTPLHKQGDVATRESAKKVAVAAASTREELEETNAELTAGVRSRIANLRWAEAWRPAASAAHVRRRTLKHGAPIVRMPASRGCCCACARARRTRHT